MLVKLGNIDNMIEALSAGVAKVAKEKSNIEFPMMKLLRGSLQEAGLLERES